MIGRTQDEAHAVGFRDGYHIGFKAGAEAMRATILAEFVIDIEECAPWIHEVVNAMQIPEPAKD
jgi:flagellar biosynthesis/type III secretory pathway protein FliH